MNIIALDMDGVVSDGYVGQILDVRFEYPYTEEEMLKYGVRKYDVETLNKQNVHMLLSALDDTAQFVLVSSWISTSAEFATYKMVEKLFQHIQPRSIPYFHGQTAFGGGGVHREYCFFGYVFENFQESLDVLEIFAIDDSGVRHFPVMDTMQRLITTGGLDGFSAMDAITLKSLLKNYDQRYPKTWMDSYVTTHRPKPIGEDGFELLSLNATRDYYSNLQKLQRLAV